MVSVKAITCWHGPHSRRIMPGTNADVRCEQDLIDTVFVKDVMGSIAIDCVPMHTLMDSNAGPD